MTATSRFKKCPACGGSVWHASDKCGNCGWSLLDPNEQFGSGAAVVVRVYPGGTLAEATRLMARETPIAERHGYAIASQVWAEKKNTAGRALMFGAWSMVVPPRGGALAVTFEKRPAASTTAVDLPDQLRKLAELRDAGILTQEEFDAKKADLLSRM